MRIFTRYILREVCGYALLGGVLFTFILFMRYLLPLMEFAVRGIASPTDLLKVISYLLPNFLTLTIPMAVLIGILLGLSRLAADSEVTAMRASGMGVLKFIQIVSVLSVAATAAGLFNSLWLAPKATQALMQFEARSKSSQETVMVQPRVFYEDLKNHVLYAQEVEPGLNGAALWKHVFLADMSKPESPHILSANEAVVVANSSQSISMELRNGTRHDTSADDPSRYDLSTFATTEVPVQTDQSSDGPHLTRLDSGLQAMSTREIWQKLHSSTSSDKRILQIELNRRFSFPVACFVLMLVGVPLGLSSKRGGKGAGFVVTLLLVFLYYFGSSMGIAFARQGKLSPFVGVWAANFLFTAAGALLIQQLSRGGMALNLFAGAGAGIGKLFERLGRERTPGEPRPGKYGDAMQRLRRTLHSRFPLILDEYVMGSFLRNFVMVLLGLTVLFLIFTFFELIGDIIKYRTPLVTVGDYLLNLIPFVLYNVTPVCSLIAVLITFGTLNRTSELTAMKATGTSLYRIIAPVLLVATLLSAALFAFDEGYLPEANRRQESLLNTIRGKPAQTYLRPDRKWMSGQLGKSGEPTRIFYYQFFDPDKNVFANLTVFEFRPGTFTLTRRIFATSAHWSDQQGQWVFDNGWQRTFEGEAISGYTPFTTANFAEIHEKPAYFKKEDRQSEQMSYSELSTYVRDLKQSGFDTMRLQVQLNRKLAYPLVTLVMAILAIPFSLSAGKKGSIAGMGAAIGLAISYWVIAGIFENLGNVNSLPAVLAAWTPDLLFAMVGSYLLLRSPT